MIINGEALDNFRKPAKYLVNGHDDFEVVGGKNFLQSDGTLEPIDVETALAMFEAQASINKNVAAGRAKPGWWIAIAPALDDPTFSNDQFVQVADAWAKKNGMERHQYWVVVHYGDPPPLGGSEAKIKEWEVRQTEYQNMIKEARAAGAPMPNIRKHAQVIFNRVGPSGSLNRMPWSKYKNEQLAREFELAWGLRHVEGRHSVIGKDEHGKDIVQRKTADEKRADRQNPNKFKNATQAKERQQRRGEKYTKEKLINAARKAWRMSDTQEKGFKWTKASDEQWRGRIVRFRKEIAKFGYYVARGDKGILIIDAARPRMSEKRQDVRLLMHSISKSLAGEIVPPARVWQSEITGRFENAEENWKRFVKALKPAQEKERLPAKPTPPVMKSPQIEPPSLDKAKEKPVQEPTIAAKISMPRVKNGPSLELMAETMHGRAFDALKREQQADVEKMRVTTLRKNLADFYRSMREFVRTVMLALAGEERRKAEEARKAEMEKARALSMEIKRETERLTNYLIETRGISPSYHPAIARAIQQKQDKKLAMEIAEANKGKPKAKAGTYEDGKFTPASADTGGKSAAK